MMVGASLGFDVFPGWRRNKEDPTFFIPHRRDWFQKED